MNFYLSALPGFMEYQATYTQFRILKCVVRLNTDYYVGDELQTQAHYLVAPSRPFVNGTLVGSSNANSALKVVGVPRSEDELRQTRWQKIIYPKTTTTSLRLAFYPYTVTAAPGPVLPAPAGSSYNYYIRVHEGRRWMPFQWASPNDYSGSPNDQLRFFGPYVAIHKPDGNHLDLSKAIAANCTLEVWVQFRGQK